MSKKPDTVTMVTMFKVVGRSIIDNYGEPIYRIRARETKGSYIYPGHRVDKAKLDVFYAEEWTGINVRMSITTLDESKIPGYLLEIRKRIKEHVEYIKNQANDLFSQIIAVEEAGKPYEFIERLGDVEEG